MTGLASRGVEAATADRSGAQPEQTGVVHDQLEGVFDDFSGHGTFIAGLIRQTCPDADLLVIQVMDSDGFVPESTMINASSSSRDRRAEGQRGGCRVDVVRLLPRGPDAAKTASLLQRAPGPGATKPGRSPSWSPRPATTPPIARMLPAGVHRHRQLISVGARNPNGTVALFSNAGTWVDTYWTGAQVFSTHARTPSTEPFSRRPAPSGTASCASRWTSMTSPAASPPGRGPPSPHRPSSVTACRCT